MSKQYVAKVTGKGQITIPKELREAIGLRDGEYVLLYQQGQGVRMEKAIIAPLERFEDLAARTEERFRQQGITEETVAEAIRWARENRG